jgi:hypothetical protein
MGVVVIALPGGRAEGFDDEILLGFGHANEER